MERIGSEEIGWERGKGKREEGSSRLQLYKLVAGDEIGLLWGT